MERIHKHCNKISVVKVNLPSSPILSMLIIHDPPPKQKETSQLGEVCNDLSKYLRDPQQSNYDNIKRPVRRPSSFYIPLM